MPEEVLEQQQVASPDNAAQTSETESQVSEQTAVADTATEANEAVTDEQKNREVQEQEKQKAERRSRGVQKRMDELTRDKYAERQAREALEKQNAELLAMLKGGAKQSQAVDADAQPTPDQFTDYQEYIRADARWIARQEAKALVEQTRKTMNEEQQRTAQEQSERQMAASFAQRQREIAKAIPDYEQTMADGAHEINVPNGVFDMIRRMPGTDGHLVAYHMVKTPALADQFFSNPPELHGVLLGQLLATVKGAAKVSNAPPPGKIVRANTGSSSEPPEDTAAYFAWAEKHMR